MADKINLTIDGNSVTVPAGTNVVDAAREAGVAVPVFCYHPRMEAVGMCRMCLVAVGTPKVDRATGEKELDEQGKPVIAMMPKLITGCTTPVSEGMVVYTQTEDVKFAQRGILEFLLTSHPLDCPVCDKGGECPLQNLTMEWGPGNTRFDYSDKVHFEKPFPLGDLILLDRERCILCGRCVRYGDEIADDPVLGYESRGRNWHIISKSDPPFDSKFSGNTTDICPVGALTTADFRFKARAWEMEAIPSICPHCPVGCNLALDMRHNEIKRVMPRENAAVNDIWICDKGRFGLRFVESKERVTTPLIRRGSQLEPVTWDEAFAKIAEKFAAAHKNVGGEGLAGLASDRLANEDLYLFQRLFRDVFGSNNLDHRIGVAGEAENDDLGAMLGVGSDTNLMELGKGTTVLVLGADPEEEAPLYMLRLRGIAQRGGNLIVANARPTKLDRSATQVLHYRPGTERHVVQGLLHAMLDAVDTSRHNHRPGFGELRDTVQQTALTDIGEKVGLSEDDLRTLVQQLVQAENGIIVYGAEALSFGPALTHDLGSLAILAEKVGRANNGLIALLPHGNSRGALDMGVRPDKGPGYTDLNEPGLAARELWGAITEGRVRGLYIAGVDPARENPACRTALGALDVLVVQDMFMTATAELADVVLPAAAFVEYDGTYTNAERRVQRARQARRLAANEQSRPGWEIVQGVAQALGATLDIGSGWDYLRVNDVAAEIAERVPGYTGITYQKLTSTGTTGTWGRQTNEAIYYDGTNYENAEGVGVQYPASIEQEFDFNLKTHPVEEPATSDRYPFVLLVQQLLYDGDPLLRESLLVEHVPESYVALSTADAEHLGISAGERVQVSSSQGSLELAARVLVDLPAGSVLIPANLPDVSLATIQTGPRTSVAVGKTE